MKSFALALSALATACGGSGHTQMPNPGVANLKFVALAPTDPSLTVEMGDIRLSRIALGGSVPPPPGVDMPQLDLDLTKQAGQSTMLTGYPAGFYEVVLLDYHGVMISGHWRGISFVAHVEPVGMPGVHCHAAAGQMLGDDEDASFTISIDVNSWFETGSYLLLDGAVAEDGKITIDDTHNPGVADQIAQNVSASFAAD